MTLNDEIKAIYAELPAIECQRECWRACGPIAMSHAEADQVSAHIAEFPLRLPMEGNDNLCPALSLLGNCMIYEVRPLICRLYGLVQVLHCPHGCLPEQWVSNREARNLMERLESLGRPGYVPLPVPGAPTLDSVPFAQRERGLLAVLRALSEGD